MTMMKPINAKWDTPHRMAQMEFDYNAGCWEGRDAMLYARTIRDWLLFTHGVDAVIERNANETRLWVPRSEEYWWPLKPTLWDAELARHVQGGA
jgi:hypothetical protein